MSRLRTILFLFVLLAALSTVRTVQAASPEAAAAKAKNPHNDSGDCGICHVATRDKLQGGWFVFASTKRELIADPTSLCRKCHGISFGHGTGKKPGINRANLPLNADGTINCALTCHDMHISGVDDREQMRLHLRLPLVKLCLSCHDK